MKMAASSESLFNLVDQLQHLESTVTNLIFEMAFKLSSLTSTNIFVMVENNLGRKYAGKSHLCAEYATTGLKTHQNDIKVEFDPESGLIKECPQHLLVPHDMCESSREVDVDFETTIFRHDQQQHQTQNNNKRRHPVAHDAMTTSSSIEKRRRQSNRSSADDPFGGKPENSMQLAKIERDASFDNNHHYNDDDVMIEEFTMENPASMLDNHHARNLEMIEAHANHFTARDIDDVVALSSDVDCYFGKNDKVAALRSLTFEVAGVEVNALTPAFKIMTSVLYDVSKMAAGTAPTRDKRDPTARAHFDRHFDKIMNEFPQLRMLTDQGVKVKSAGFGSFVRSTMQKTYGKLLDKALHADAKYNNDGEQLKSHAYPTS